MRHIIVNLVIGSSVSKLYLTKSSPEQCTGTFCFLYLIFDPCRPLLCAAVQATGLCCAQAWFTRMWLVLSNEKKRKRERSDGGNSSLHAAN